MTRYNYMVIVKPKAGREEEYGNWHRDRHVDDVLKIDGMLNCTRFRLVDPQPDGAPPKWVFASIYEIESDNPQIQLDEMKRRFGTDLMPGTEAGDASNTVRMMFEPISRHKKA